MSKLNAINQSPTNSDEKELANDKLSTVSVNSNQNLNSAPVPSVIGTHGPRLKWTAQTEGILVKWSDNAICYKWLHDKSFRKYRYLNYLYTIPVIIISTITGTLSVGISSLVPANMTEVAQIIIGITNIFAGIITTLLNFFRYAQLSEAHSNSAMGWAKLQRVISVELALERDSRKDADTFIKMCRNDYERLIEQAPVIPSEVLHLFKKKFADVSDIIFPEACAKISHTKVYKSFEIENLEQYTNEELDLLNEAKIFTSNEKNKSTKTNNKLHDVILKFKSNYESKHNLPFNNSNTLSAENIKKSSITNNIPTYDSKIINISDSEDLTDILVV
jgi:hypothetical protein